MVDEEERAEYVRIRKKEFEDLEKKLVEKQNEVLEHLNTNQSLQAAMLATAQGNALSAEEMQKIIERSVYPPRKADFYSSVSGESLSMFVLHLFLGA